MSPCSPSHRLPLPKPMTSFSSPSAFPCAKAFTSFDSPQPLSHSRVPSFWRTWTHQHPSLVIYPINGNVTLSTIQSGAAYGWIPNPALEPPVNCYRGPLKAPLLLGNTFFLCPVMIARNSHNYTNSGHYILCLDVGFVCGLIRLSILLLLLLLSVFHHHL